LGSENWPDGAHYYGYYKDGKKQGKGKLSFADGSWYEGEFDQNDIHGFGIYQWADQRRYEGNWFRNKMHGKGKTTWGDGREYDGEYTEDKKHGTGTFKWYFQVPQLLGPMEESTEVNGSKANNTEKAPLLNRMGKKEKESGLKARGFGGLLAKLMRLSPEEIYNQFSYYWFT
jgi:hypothetical protein